jgi:hypothetical protein
MWRQKVLNTGHSHIYEYNGRIYGDAYVITVKVGPLRARTHTHTHTHLSNRSCRCWKHRLKASIGIFRNSAVAFRLMVSLVVKRVPLRPIARVRNSQMSLGGKPRKYGGWVTTGIFFSARKCCTIRSVGLGACRDAETAPGSLPLASPHPPKRFAQPLHYWHEEMTSNTLFRQHELMCTKPSMSTNSRDFLTALHVPHVDFHYEPLYTWRCWTSSNECYVQDVQNSIPCNSGKIYHVSIPQPIAVQNLMQP